MDLKTLEKKKKETNTRDKSVQVTQWVDFELVSSHEKQLVDMMDELSRKEMEVADLTDELEKAKVQLDKIQHKFHKNRGVRRKCLGDGGALESVHQPETCRPGT